MTDTIKTACVQMNSGPDINENLKAAETLIREAAGKGATLIATPENTDYILSKPAEKVAQGHTAETHPGIPFFASLAKELNIHLIIGSMGIKVKEDKLANRSFLFTPDGETGATFDKIHLFDVDLSTGESHRESNYFEPGNEAVVYDLGPTKLGMSVCYDLRFAYLYRAMAKAGAGILSIPAAFTVPTGQAHWEVLHRARAIETGCFVLAPAQVGEHEGGRKTYGHSMIIGPWGNIIAQKEEGAGIIMGDLHLAEITKTRQAIPSLQHDREFEVSER